MLALCGVQVGRERHTGECFSHCTGLSVIQLRVATVYGPGSQDIRKLVPYVILELLRGRAPVLGSGVRQVDWIYVEDVVEGMLRAGSVEFIDAFSVDVGTGRLTSIRGQSAAATRQDRPHRRRHAPAHPGGIPAWRAPGLFDGAPAVASGRGP